MAAKNQNQSADKQIFSVHSAWYVSCAERRDKNGPMKRNNLMAQREETKQRSKRTN